MSEASPDPGPARAVIRMAVAMPRHGRDSPALQGPARADPWADETVTPRLHEAGNNHGG